MDDGAVEPQVALNSFLHEFCGIDPGAEDEVSYFVEEFDEGIQGTVVLHCLEGREFCSELASTSAEAQMLAVTEVLKFYEADFEAAAFIPRWQVPGASLPPAVAPAVAPGAAPRFAADRDEDQDWAPSSWDDGGGLSAKIKEESFYEETPPVPSAPSSSSRRSGAAPSSAAPSQHKARDLVAQERRFCTGDKKWYTFTEYMQWAPQFFGSEDDCLEYWETSMRPEILQSAASSVDTAEEQVTPGAGATEDFVSTRVALRGRLSQTKSPCAKEPETTTTAAAKARPPKKRDLGKLSSDALLDLLERYTGRPALGSEVQCKIDKYVDGFQATLLLTCMGNVEVTSELRPTDTEARSNATQMALAYVQGLLENDARKKAKTIPASNPPAKASSDQRTAMPAAHSRSGVGTHVTSNFKTILCRYWAAGYCEKGEACTFIHGGDDGWSSNTKAEGWSSNAKAEGWSSNAKAEATTSNFKTIPCRYWAAGYCEKGEACTFIHAGDDKGAAADTNAGSNFAPIPCKYWAAGQCSKGEECTFIHGGVPCKFWAAGHCMKGKECPFDHEGDDTGAPVKKESTDGDGSIKPAARGTLAIRPVPAKIETSVAGMNGDAADTLTQPKPEAQRRPAIKLWKPAQVQRPETQEAEPSAAAPRKLLRRPPPKTEP